MTPVKFATCCLVLYMCGFVVSRAYLFHVAYNHRIQRHGSEEWLVQQCRSHEFYHNMKHHSSVCEDVEGRAAESLWLGALAEVVNSTYICGDEPCTRLAGNFFQFLVGQGIVVAVAFLLCLFLLPTLAVPFLRMRRMQQSRRDMHALYLHRDVHHGDPYYRPQIADSTREIHHTL